MEKGWDDVRKEGKIIGGMRNRFKNIKGVCIKKRVKERRRKWRRL